jgi:hypothetical protein
MKRCFHCSTDNMDDSEYCDECGIRLAAAASSRVPIYAPPPQPPPPPAFTSDSVTPRPATPYTPPPPPPPVHRSGSIAASPQDQSRQQQSQQGQLFNRRTAPKPVRLLVARYAQQEVDALQSEVRAKLVILQGGKSAKEFPEQ